MFDAHGGDGDPFELKHDFGGLVDVEFLVQYLVLGHAHRHAELTGNLGNISLLARAAGLGLIDDAEAAAAADAYRSLRRHQHALRLDGADSKLPAEAIAAEIAAVRSLWHSVFGDAGHRR